jgi:hypothetical protein
MKIEYIGLKPDCRQSSGQGVTMMGQAAHGGGLAAHSGGCSRPASSYVVFHLLLPEFHDFHDRILFCYRGVSPPHLFPVYLSAQHVETNIYPKIEIENR